MYLILKNNNNYCNYCIHKLKKLIITITNILNNLKYIIIKIKNNKIYVLQAYFKLV